MIFLGFWAAWWLVLAVTTAHMQVEATPWVIVITLLSGIFALATNLITKL